MQVVGIEDRDSWNRFTAGAPTGDLLQSFEWGELKARSGWKPYRLAAKDGDRIVGAISILARPLPLGKCIFYASRGPVCDPGDAETLTALASGTRELARRKGAILLKVDPPWVSGTETLLAAGFSAVSQSEGFGGVQPRCVMQLDLTPSLDEILEGCKPKWRYNIRLAEKKGVTVRSYCTLADLKSFYAVHEETAKRDRFRIRGFQYYKDMWELLAERGYAKLFLAEYEGKVIAGALSFIFGDKCWYTYGASSNEHRNVMPNHLMQ
ncbi:MAG: lipid II:glycine glycyltransferase FemX, partial [Armatimonadota bacterium]